MYAGATDPLGEKLVMQAREGYKLFEKVRNLRSRAPMEGLDFDGSGNILFVGLQMKEDREF